MPEKPEFEKRKLVVFSNYIYWLMITNMMFLGAISPTLAGILFIEPAFSNFLLYVVVFMPVGPALGALIACMIKILEKHDLNPAKDYWSFYRNNWKDSLRLWGLYSLAVMILVVDIYFVNQVFRVDTPFFSMFFLFLLLLLTVLLLPTFLITIKFKFSFTALLKLGMLYTATRFKLTIGNLCILFLLFVAMTLTIDLLPLLLASLILFIIVSYNHEIVVDVQKKYVEQ